MTKGTTYGAINGLGGPFLVRKIVVDDPGD